MKKLILLFALALAITPILAQPVLTKMVHEPVLADSYRVLRYDTIGVVPRNRGANQTWNFQTVASATPIDYFTYHVGSPTSFPGSPTCSMVEHSYLTDKTYYDEAGGNSPLVISGMTTTIGTADIANLPFLYRPWPIPYNNVFGSSCSGTFESTNPNVTTPLSLSGNFIGRASGYGTVIGPDGRQFANALQVVDSFQLDGSGTISGGAQVLGSITKLIHSYYLDGIRYPVIRFTEYKYQEAVLIGGNPTFQNLEEGYSLEYNESAVLTSIGENLLTEVTVSPNPASSMVRVSLPSESPLEMRNAMGQTIWSVKSALGTIEVPTQQLASGIYFLQTAWGSKKLVINH